MAARLSGMTVAAFALAGAAVAAAPPAYPPYPTSRAPGVMAAWLAEETDIDPAAVVGVGEDSLFALEPAPGGAAPPYRRMALRQEALRAAFAGALGGRSLVMIADVDCARRRIFERALDLYRGNNKQGAKEALGPGDDWEPVAPGSAIANAVDLVCADAPASPAPPATTSETSPRTLAPTEADLGAFDSGEAAETAWRGLVEAYPVETLGKRRRVELDIVAGRPRYRLLVSGFGGQIETSAFCAALRAGGRNCVAGE